jgi:hypothetical protein
MTAKHRHKLLARPARDRGLAPSCAGLGASVHQPPHRCAYNVLARPWPQPCAQGMALSCAATRADIADTGG